MPPPDPPAPVRSLLDAGGPLAQGLAGYERREGQLRMAEAVEEALAAGDQLLVEAGTGTGKTLAYLLPAARLGEPVVISTGTKNLQDQIFFKDVPLLQHAIGTGVRATYLKGRDNYLCIHRFREFSRAPTFPDTAEAKAFRWIAEWSERTEHGDRGELAAVPEGISFWRDINARSDTCLGRKCPEYDDCFLVRMRREAAEAIRDQAGRLFDSFRGRRADRERLRPAVWTAPRVEALGRLLAALSEMEAGLGTVDTPTDDLVAARRRAGEIVADLQFTTQGEDSAHVRWVEVGPRAASFHASPIDVSAPLQEHLFSRLTSVVLTSATLTVGGEFDFIRSRLGLPEARALTVSSPFDFASQALLYLPAGLPPPDAAGFPAAAAEQVRALLRMTGGRAFLLFTSYAGMRRMRELLDADPHDYTLLQQGEGARHALLERFRSSHRAVLLATSSFWQGVDVQGEALGLVVIDRLPFEVPSDPVVEARVERLRRSGENAFRSYQIPQAVIGLKQGAGRLIRSTRDRGVLALLDGRVSTRSYGGIFLDSLPPFARASDLEEVRRFLDGG